VLKKEILQRAVTREGWLSGTLDREVADASVLLLPQIGLLPATHEAFLKTLSVTEQKLLKNGFVLRYNEADDFGLPATAFLVCTNWYIDALALAGRRDEARELFENLLQRRNAAGLFSEDIDPQNGELWGNFPQTYSQVGTILSAHRLSRTWEQGLWHAS
jgi:GH15 family glucan-1,4-alpha-glucosidase